MSEPRLYKIIEAAQQLEISRSTLYRHIQAGNVPYRVMSNGSLRMSQTDIDETCLWLSEPVFVHQPEQAA